MRTGTSRFKRFHSSWGEKKERKREREKKKGGGGMTVFLFLPLLPSTDKSARSCCRLSVGHDTLPPAKQFKLALWSSTFYTVYRVFAMVLRLACYDAIRAAASKAQLQRSN